MYWDLMNDVRSEPYIPRFEVGRFLKIRYWGWSASAAGTTMNIKDDRPLRGSIVIEHVSCGVAPRHRCKACIALAVNGNYGRRCQIRQGIEIEGAAIRPAAKCACEGRYHCFTGRIPLTGFRDWHRDFEDACAADAGDKLLQSFISKPEIGCLSAPITEQ